MKCKRCGARIKDGRMYCSVCGMEVQMVSGDGDFEEEYLKRIIRESTFEPKETDKTDGKPPKKKVKKTAVILIVLFFFILLAGVAAELSFRMYRDYQNANSYDYQMEMAQKSRDESDDETALAYYQAALALNPEDITARFAMADIRMERKEVEEAKIIYKDILGLDTTNRKAYEKLIAIYESEEQYGEVLEMMENVTDKSLLSLFHGYTVKAPEFTPETGKYEEFLEVEIVSPEWKDIFYTVDGTTPSAENGSAYPAEEPISLDEEGEYIIKAICRNEKGIYSEVTEAEYTIEIPPPAYAKVVPDGGRMEELSYVTITAQSGCVIYYTWDGSDPTRNSARYSGAIEVPEGNNILSVLVVDPKTGHDSGVYRANFIYYP